MNKFCYYFVLSFLFVVLLSVSYASKNLGVENDGLDKVIFSGYLDGSYNYLVRSNKFLSGDPDRLFDVEPNGLMWNQAAMTLAYRPKGFGGLLNLTAGHDAPLVASYGFRPYEKFSSSRNLGLDMTQGFVQHFDDHYGKLMLGKFYSIAGYETIDSTRNFNFSRSILFLNEPYTVTGIREKYYANDKLKLIVGINDGWDEVRDWRRRPTIELAAYYNFNKKWSISLVDYNGEERVTPLTRSGPKGVRNITDLIVTFHADDKLTFVINYDYVLQTKAALPNGSLARAIWTGIAGYMNYKFIDSWRVALRGEIYDDHNGFTTGVKQLWSEATFTIAYEPIKYFELRAETRRDFSNVKSFVNSNNASRHRNQQSFALEGILKYS